MRVADTANAQRAFSAVELLTMNCGDLWNLTVHAVALVTKECKYYGSLFLEENGIFPMAASGLCIWLENS